MFKQSATTKLTRNDYIWNGVLILLGCVLFALIVYSLVPIVQHTYYTARYGYPRLHRIAFDINPNDKSNDLTQFIGLNLNSHVTVLAKDATGTTLELDGPWLFGRYADREPVILKQINANNDDYPDLAVEVDGMEIVYVSENGTLRLLSEDERQILVSSP